MLRHLVNNLGPLLSTTKPAGRTGVCLSTRTTSPSASSHPARARNAAGKFIRTATLAPCGGHSSDSTNAPRTLTSRVRPCDSRACPRSIHRNTTGTSSGYRTAVRCFARGGALVRRRLLVDSAGNRDDGFGFHLFASSGGEKIFADAQPHKGTKVPSRKAPLCSSFCDSNRSSTDED